MIFALTMTWFASTMRISTVSLVRSVEKKYQPAAIASNKTRNMRNFGGFIGVSSALGCCALVVRENVDWRYFGIPGRLCQRPVSLRHRLTNREIGRASCRERV